MTPEKKEESTATAEQKVPVLNCDLPLDDPAQDEFGYASFAKHLAETIMEAPCPKGLVFSINGAWGSGKTSAAHFVQFYLEKYPKRQRPIVISFNPWWFNGPEQLATQFLNQFQASLPKSSNALKSIGSKLAEYRNEIGTAISLATQLPFAKELAAAYLKNLTNEPKDVVKLKSELSSKLDTLDKKIVFVIDDIDRLTPDEIKELFKVIKALADFPNVIYLLVFDQETVSTSLEKVLGINGETYLEKIVQTPLTLPAIDPIKLRSSLFEKLDRLLSSFPFQEIDDTYWGNIYHEGLNHYIRKPRDITRIINAINVTYPPVAGEVNIVDFIALEFLRVFEPQAYFYIKEHSDSFIGPLAESRHGNDLHKEVREYHQKWLEQIDESRRSPIRNLLFRMFPKFGALVSGTGYNAQWNATWRKELRICCSELFPIYFRFGLTPDMLRRSELNYLITVGKDAKQACNILLAAAKVKKSDNRSKSLELVERLLDFKDEISPETAKGILQAIFEVGNKILTKDDETALFKIPNNWRLLWLIEHLLQCIPEVQHEEILLNNFQVGQSIDTMIFVLMDIDDLKKEPGKYPDKALGKARDTIVAQLKDTLFRRLEEMEIDTLLATPELGMVLSYWGTFAGKESVQKKISPVWENDDFLLKLLVKYLSFGSSHSWGDSVTKHLVWLNPKRLEDVANIDQLEKKILEIRTRKKIDGEELLAVVKYIEGMEKIRTGKDPARA